MSLIERLGGEMAELRRAGTYREELVLQSAQGPRVRVGGREVVMLTSNNYLGFANHPRIREAQKKAVDRWGAGLGSVRFICGTQELHKELEAEIASFFGCDDAILYMTCWSANEGLFAAVLDEPDGLYSDELNHASIIDGVRLSKAKRYRAPHGDLAALDRMLGEDTTSRDKLYITDGVFSMEGEEANLRECVRHLREAWRGPRRRRLPRDRRPGQDRPRDRRGAGGLRTGPGDDRNPRQGDGIGGRRFRDGAEGARRNAASAQPHLSLLEHAPAGRGRRLLEAFRILREDPAPVARLRDNAAYYRKALGDAGFRIPHGTHPIVPVIVGDTAKALAMGKALFEEGVYVSGFGFPVVPQGQARLRCQVSAAHERADLDKAVDAFRKVGKAFGVI